MDYFSQHIFSDPEKKNPGLYVDSSDFDPLSKPPINTQLSNPPNGANLTSLPPPPERPTQFIQEHQGVCGGVLEDGGRLTQLHKEGALSCKGEHNQSQVKGHSTGSKGSKVVAKAIVPAMMRSEAPSLVNTRSTGLKLHCSAGT